MNPLNLSYSSTELLHTCPRKFEIEKLLQFSDPDNQEIESIDLTCGKSLGLGIQKIFENFPVEKAIWHAYTAWKSSAPIFQENKKKAFWRVVKHIQKFHGAIKSGKFPELEGYELLYFEDASGARIPACELSFKIILNEGYTYRGFIDAILWNPVTGQFLVIEIKTDGMEDAAVAKYQNSFQGSSYAAILQKIVGQPVYDVAYLVFEFPKMGQQLMYFVKNPVQKLSWLTSLALDCQMIDLYKEAKHFPMRGGSCFNFYKPCHYLGVCELSNSRLGKVNPDGSYVEPKKEETQYHFTFSLQEFLEAHDANTQAGGTSGVES